MSRNVSGMRHDQRVLQQCRVINAERANDDRAELAVSATTAAAAAVDEQQEPRHQHVTDNILLEN